MVLPDLSAIKNIFSNKWFIAVLILFLVIVVMLVIFILPSDKTITINFMSEGLPINDDFSYTLLINDLPVTFEAINGVSVVEVNSQELIIKSIDSEKYKLINSKYVPSEIIYVDLERNYFDKTISLNFYYNNQPYSKQINMSFGCDEIALPIITPIKYGLNSYNVIIPDSCKKLIVNAVSEDNYVISEICDSTTCSIYFDNSLTESIPNGLLKVFVKSDETILKDADLRIYSKQDLQNPVIIGFTNSLGMKEFLLPIGEYLVFANNSGFLMNSETVNVKDNNTSVININLEIASNGFAELSFEDEYKKFVSGDLIIRDETQKIIYANFVDITGIINIPIYAFNKEYYIDFIPYDANLMPLTIIQTRFNSSGEKHNFVLKEKNTYNYSKIKVHVLDQDNNPLENMSIIVTDKITSFDLLALHLPKTDENGFSEFELDQGIYFFKVHDEFSESISEIVSVQSVDSDVQPVFDVTIIHNYSYSEINCDVYDDLGFPASFADIYYYNKPKQIILKKVLDASGKANEIFKSGKYIYVGIFSEGYLPFYTQTYFVHPENRIDINVSLTSTSEQINKIKFLGVYETLDGLRTENIIPGKSYYVGYDIYIYNKPNNYFSVETKLSHNDVNKFLIQEVLSSSDSDTIYNNIVAKSRWNSANVGVYRVFYKIQLENGASVKMHDLLQIETKLFVDNEILYAITEKNMFVGGQSICDDEGICSRVTILDLDSELYVDPILVNEYLLNTNDYNITFDITNGSESKIDTALLRMYNSLNEDSPYELIEYNLANNSLIRLNEIFLKGPAEENYIASSKYALFVEGFNFSKFYINKSISGFMTITPISVKTSYINAQISNSNNASKKTVLSIKTNISDLKDLNVQIFPTVLIPNLSQFINVKVSDEINLPLSDARVTVRIKTPEDYDYRIYSGCGNLKTDSKGEAVCRISGLDVQLGTKFQIQVEKKGYNSYYHNNSLPDIKVSNYILNHEPKKLKLNLTNPLITESSADLKLENYSGVDLEIKDINIIFDNISEDNLTVFNYNAFVNYFSLNKGMIIEKTDYGKEFEETTIKDFIKAELNQNEDLIKDEVNYSGKIILSFEDNVDFIYEVPFEISIVSENYPTNSDDCLQILYSDNIYSTEDKPIDIFFKIKNSCNIESADNIYPITINELYAMIEVADSQYSLGKFSSINMDSAIISDTIYFNNPKLIATNVETNLNETLSNVTLGFVPGGRKGSANYKIKLIGLVNSNNEVLRIESNVFEFKINVFNLEDCIKIFNSNDKEIDILHFDQLDVDEPYDEDKISFYFKNVCQNVPIILRVCSDNEGNFSNSCGSVNDSYLRFNNAQIIENSGINLNDRLDLDIFRPKIPGAYSIDVWARTTNEFSAKKITDVKVNVMTSGISGLYTEYPFLETTNNTSEVAQVYNTWIGRQSGLSITDNFLNFVNEDCSNSGEICFMTFEDIGDAGINAGKALYATGVTSATISAAILTSLLITMSVEASYLGLLTITGAIAVAAVGIPVVGWIVAGAAGLIAIGTLIGAVFTSHMEQDDEDYALYIEPSDEIIELNYNVENPLITELDKILHYSGEDRFLFLSHYKSIWGEVGWTTKYWNDQLNFDMYCPSDYELYAENIFIPEKEDSINNVDIKYDDCEWNSPKYDINNNKVTFYPKCGGNSFTNFEMETYVLLACKLKSDLWGRAQQGGVYTDTKDTGFMKLQFTDVDFLDCDEEWCYKNYDLNFSNDALGTKIDYIRLAFHKDNDDLLTKEIGENCYNNNGDVIGVTGPEAVPKIEYNWVMSGANNVDSNFCIPNDSGEALHFCDATQFFGSNIKRIITADTELKEISYNLDCPKTNNQKRFDFEVNVSDPNKLFGITKPKIAYDKDNEMVQVGIALKPIVVKSDEENTIIAKIKHESFEKFLDCNFLKMDANNTHSLLRPYCVFDIKEFELPTVSGIYDIYHENDTFYLSINERITQTAELKFDINYIFDEGKCIYVNPTTYVSNGKMMLFDFFSDDDEHQSKLFDIQNTLYYRAYLMNDGFSEDFLKDFFESCDTQFLACPAEFEALKKAFDEGRLKIINRFDGSNKTNGAGLYNIYNQIKYPHFSKGLSLDDKNTEIIIAIEKIPANFENSVLYYMPLNGRTGINVDTVDRQGYGVEFTGDMITLYTNNIDTLQSNLQVSETSDALKTLSINTSYDLFNQNKNYSGLIFNVEKSADEINVNFYQNIFANKISVHLENSELTKDTGIYYNLSNEGVSLPNDTINLLWYAEDYDATDFTGNNLSTNYPLIANKSTKSEYYANINYPANVVKYNANYDIYSFVYTQNEKIGFNVNKMNLKNFEYNVDEVKFNINSLNAVFSGISEKKLCVAGNANELSVFVNESELITN